MKKSLTAMLILIFGSNSFSQTWYESIQRGDNFYTIQNAFNAHWKDKDNSVKGHGYKQYKRWEYFMEARVYPSGNIYLPSTTWDNYQTYLKENGIVYGKTINSNSQINSTTWQPMGPMGNLSGVADNGLPRKAGRDNFITFHPTSSNTFWVGAPAGGLWKTVNSGASWTTNTDNLSVIGCSDLAIDPSNTNIMYLATGDGYNFNARSSFCIGVLKTTDGGANWLPTGLTFTVNQMVNMRRLIINPTNPQIIIAATSLGIYTSTNAAASWSLTSGANAYDLEFNVANSNTVYAAGGTFSMSINGGLSFSQITNGIPAGGGRTAIAVSAANSNYVYALKTNANLLTGVYRSINGGNTFSLMANSPNILSSDCTTPIADGQGNYDLSFAVSPLNINEVVVGGINVWRSLNGGSTFTNIGCSYGTVNPPFIHADHHELEYNSTGVLYGVNDGGICSYNGLVWNDLTNPRNIAQIYKIGLSTLSPNLWMTGHQDNGSNIYNNGIYSASLMGDGMDCFVDRTDDQKLYAEKFNGQLYYSGNGGLAWTTCTTGAGAAGAFVTPWKQDPQVATTFYCGRSQMKKSTVWPPVWLAPVGTMTGVNAAQFITEFAIAPSNNQKIYAIHGTTGMFVSNDAGATWNISNTGIPTWAGALTFVTVHPTNSQIAWTTMSGFTAGMKVFKTINGGTTWANVSYTLPNIPANCSVFEMNSTIDRVYIGMDVGIYYLDNTNPTVWTLYNTGLPNTPISDMEISPASPTKIRAATYGRGVYQADVVPSALPPVSAFNFAGTSCSVTASLLFNDISTNAPNTWTWSVNPSAGVTISTPSSQNPTITIANFGTYSVSLLAGNGFGPGNLSTQTIIVAPPAINLSASSSVVCNGQTLTLTAGGANSYTWQPGNLNGISVTYSPAITQVYSVTGTTASGCNGSSTVNITVTVCATGIISNAKGDFSYFIYPNPTYDKLNIKVDVASLTHFEVSIHDVTGKEVLKQSVQFSNTYHQHQINTSSLESGVYILRISSADGESSSFKIIKE